MPAACTHEPVCTREHTPVPHHRMASHAYLKPECCRHAYTPRAFLCLIHTHTQTCTQTPTKCQVFWPGLSWRACRELCSPGSSVHAPCLLLMPASSSLRRSWVLGFMPVDTDIDAPPPTRTERAMLRPQKASTAVTCACTGEAEYTQTRMWWMMHNTLLAMFATGFLKAALSLWLCWVPVGDV